MHSLWSECRSATTRDSGPERILVPMTGRRERMAKPSMKVVILAGGLGQSPERRDIVRPKPMVEIGGMPALCTSLKIYSPLWSP